MVSRDIQEGGQTNCYLEGLPGTYHCFSWELVLQTLLARYLGDRPPFHCLILLGHVCYTYIVVFYRHLGVGEKGVNSLGRLCGL